MQKLLKTKRKPGNRSGPLWTLSRLTILLTLTGTLSGCALLEAMGRALGLEPKVQYIVGCPQLDAPPEGAIDALEAKARVDPPTALWVNRLANHYEVLENCPEGPVQLP